MPNGLTPTIGVEAEIPVELDGGAEIHAEIVGGAVIETELVASGPLPGYYAGPYEFTPSEQEQTIPIRGKIGLQNITIGAIPNNYGLITWNGSVLTVS